MKPKCLQTRIPSIRIDTCFESFLIMKNSAGKYNDAKQVEGTKEKKKKKKKKKEGRRVCIMRQ